MPFALSQRSKPRTLTTMDSTTITARLVAISSRTRFMVFGSPLPGLGGGGLLGLQDRPRSLLGYDIRRRIGVPRGDARKDRGVDNPQPINAMHTQRIVDLGGEIVQPYFGIRSGVGRLDPHPAARARPQVAHARRDRRKAVQRIAEL